MNKARRHELKMLKYKRRLRVIGHLSSTTLASPVGLEKGVHYNFTGFRSHGKPCSCSVCSPYKYERAKEKRAAVKLFVSTLI